MNRTPDDNFIDVIDSHTGGEPTRVVVRGGPSFNSPDPAMIRAELAASCDAFRRAVVCEPRGSDVLVGALLCPPYRPGSTAGVVFFNNVGYLRMCGHGAIGVAVTLAYLGRIGPGRHLLDTPAGAVAMTLHDANRASIENVASYRHRRDVTVHVPGIGDIRGDIAWGGNWFFLVRDHHQRVASDNVAALTAWTSRLRDALDASDLRGAAGELIDHIELSGPPGDPARADSRNFVLCPGRVYDRSPCGTGTSARLACLIEDGELEPGDAWRQEGITGSIFTARAARVGKQLVPSITGEAWVTSEARLRIDPGDPFGYGIPAGDR